jgi:recombinational DNA repair protein (RecF pathway)
MACSVCGSSDDHVFYHDDFYCSRCWHNETCIPTDYPSQEDVLSTQKMEDEAIFFNRVGG